MRLQIRAVTGKRPRWETDAFSEYAKRLPRHYHLELVEIPLLGKGNHGNTQQLRYQQSEKLFEALPGDANIIVLDQTGKQITSADLSKSLSNWLNNSENIVFMIGGPDGIASEFRGKANTCFSLSSFTLTHGMARIILIEQLYRAHTILSGHPYHRD